jgi:hypothetical protein
MLELIQRLRGFSLGGNYQKSAMGCLKKGASMKRTRK